MSIIDLYSDVCFKAEVAMSRMQFWTIHDIEQMERNICRKKVEAKDTQKKQRRGIYKKRRDSALILKNY